MSTRTSIVLVTEQETTLHLYKELHDGEVHLEIALDRTNIRLNLVIPQVLVPGLTTMLCRHLDPHEPTETRFECEDLPACHAVTASRSASLLAGWNFCRYFCRLFQKLRRWLATSEKAE